MVNLEGIRSFIFGFFFNYILHLEGKNIMYYKFFVLYIEYFLPFQMQKRYGSERGDTKSEA